VPDHELLRLIGRGSYGEVWLARTVLGVYRAVKIVHRSSFSDDRPFERELNGIQEFEPISRSHAAFIAILHVGENKEKGYFYYVMELADDQVSGQQIIPEQYRARTLSSDIAARTRIPLAESIVLGRTISDALATLHKAGLVHRDVKPSNIIFLAGQPKLADIGLVHTIEGAATFVGTHGYIAPEGPGTVQADIYAFGKLLYEISTGNDRQQFPEVPSFIAQSDELPLFREFNEILSKACAADLRQRYAAAEQLHAELQLISEGRSLRRLRALERRWKIVSRVGGIALAALVVSGLISYEIIHERSRAAQARAAQAATSLAYGGRLLAIGDPHGALSWYLDAFRADIGNTSAERTDRVRLGSALEFSPRLVRCWWTDRPVRYMDISPDQQLVACAHGDKGTVDILSFDNGKLLRTVHHDSVLHVRFSPDSRRIATASRDKVVRVWSTMDDIPPLEIQHDAAVSAAVFSPDGTQLLTAVSNGTAALWNAADGKLIRRFRGHAAEVFAVAFSPDGQRIVTASADQRALVWDIKAEQPLFALAHENWVDDVAFSPDGRWIATASADKTVRVWDAKTGQLAFQPLVHPMMVGAVKFSPDARFVVSTTLGAAVSVWDLGTEGTLRCELRHGGNTWDGVFTPDGRLLLTAGTDGAVRFWEVSPPATTPLPCAGSFCADGSRRFVIESNAVVAFSTAPSNVLARIPFNTGVDAIVSSANGARFLAIPSDLGKAAIIAGYDLDRRQSLELPMLPGFSASRCWLADNAAVAITANAEQLQAWDLHSGRQLASWRAPAPLAGAAVSADGTVVAAWESTNAYLIDARSGTQLGPALIHDLAVKTAVFDQSGGRVLTCCSSEGVTAGYAQAWDCMTREAMGPRLAHHDGVVSIAFSPDGNLIATGSEDNKARVWDLHSGRGYPEFDEGGQVWSVAFSDDGKWLVTGSTDRTARIWDLQTFTPVIPALRFPELVRNARLINHGRLLVVSGRSMTCLFDLPREDSSDKDLATVIGFLNGRKATPTDQAVVTRWMSRLSHAEQMSQAEWHFQQARLCFFDYLLYGAEFHTKRAMDLEGPSADRLYWLASSRAGQGKWKEALDAYRALPAGKPVSARTRDLIALLELATDDRASVRNTLRILGQEISKAGLPAADECWAMGLAPKQYVDPAIALRLGGALAARPKNDSPDKALAALLLWRHGGPESQAHAQQQLSDSDPLAPETHYVRALIHGRFMGADQRESDSARTDFANVPVVMLNPLQWSRRLRLLLLEREAKALVETERTTNINGVHVSKQ